MKRKSLISLMLLAAVSMGGLWQSRNRHRCRVI